MIGQAVLAAVAGVSAWLSLGTVAVVDDRSLARVAALPPLSWLVVFVMFAVVLAVSVRIRRERAWPLAIAALVWLPYLPFRIPPAFLMWSGPLEGLVWIAVVAGVLWGAPSATFAKVQALVCDPKRAPLLGAAIVAACSGLGFAALNGVVPAGDEPHYLVITQSLLRDGDLLIENNHKRGDYRSYFKGDMPKADYIVRGDDGQIYPIHPLGISVLVLPGFGVAGYRGAVATVILCTAAASALAWHTAWLLSASAGGAWFAWAAVFLTTPYFFHTFTIFPDGVGGLLAMVGVWLIVQLELGRRVDRRMLFLCGISLALLPWFHTRFAILAASFGVVVVARLLAQSARVARVAAFLAAPIVSGAAWFSYFWIIWGTPNPAAPYGTETNTAVANIGRGLTGLLIDQQFGLIANAPIYALAVAGMISLARYRPRLARELAVVSLPYMLAVSAFHMWWGGVSAPARFLAALMPVAVVPIAWWWRQSKSSRTLGLALLLLSIGMVIPYLTVDGDMVYNDRDGFDRLLDWAASNVDLPTAFPSVHRGTTGLALAEAAVWIFAGLLLTIVVSGFLTAFAQRASAVKKPDTTNAEPDTTAAGARWTATAWSSAIAAMCACSAVWAMSGEPGVTANRSQVALLTSWRREWQTTMVRLRPFRRLTVDDFVRQIEVGSTDRVRREAADPTMLKTAMLPAGDYDVVTRGGGPLSGELFVWIGKTDRPSERWRLEGHQPGLSGLVLRLPVPASTMVLRGDAEAKATVAEATLRPRSLRRSADPAGRYARTAIRYGSTRAFFMDDRAYMEDSGFWTRGETSTTVVIDADPNAAPPTVWLQSGPIATSAELSVGDFTERVSVAAQSRKAVALPALTNADSWVLTIHSGPAFRPVDHDPRNLDTRLLGVWVEIR